MPQPFGRKAVKTGSDTHAASLDGSDTHGATVNIGDVFNSGSGVLGGNDVNPQGRSIWSNDRGTTETTEVTIGISGLTATNLCVCTAAGLHMKITNNGDMTYRIRRNSLTGTIIASETDAGATATTIFGSGFQGVSANDIGFSSMLITVQASTTGIRSAFMGGSFAEVNSDLSGADTHSASLTGTNTVACELRF